MIKRMLGVFRPKGSELIDKKVFSKVIGNSEVIDFIKGELTPMSLHSGAFIVISKEMFDSALPYLPKKSKIIRISPKEIPLLDRRHIISDNKEVLIIVIEDRLDLGMSSAVLSYIHRVHGDYLSCKVEDEYEDFLVNRTMKFPIFIDCKISTAWHQALPTMLSHGRALGNVFFFVEYPDDDKKIEDMMKIHSSVPG